MTATSSCRQRSMMPASSSSSSDEATDLVWALQEEGSQTTPSSKAATDLDVARGANEEEESDAEPIRGDVDCVLQRLSETIETLADDAAVCLQDHQEASAIIWNELMDQVEERDVLDERLVAKVAAIRRLSEAQIAAAAAEAAASATEPRSPNEEQTVLEISLRVDNGEDDEGKEEEEEEEEAAAAAAAERAYSGGGCCAEGASVVPEETSGPPDPATRVGDANTALWRLFALEMEAELRRAEEAIEAEAQEERDLHGRVAEMLEDMRCRVRSAVHTERVARERSEEELLRSIEAGFLMSGLTSPFEALPQADAEKGVMGHHHCTSIGNDDGVKNNPVSAAFRPDVMLNGE